MQDDTFVKHKFLSTSTRENSVEITPITPLKTPSKIDLVKRFAFQGSNKIEKVLAANVTERDQVAPPFSLPEPFQNVLSPDKNHSKIYKSLSNDSKNLILHSESDLNLFELSIIQFFHCHDNKNFKLIYLASTLQNSLKKFQYWLGIFSDTGISFGLISADSFGNEVSILQSNQVIVTTAKTWCQFNVKRGSLSIELLIKGFLVDEIGALGDRCDSSLELVVTGMKVSCPSLRIITFAPFSKFSYVDDLSQWLGPVTILSIFQRGKQSMKPNLLVQAFPFKNIFQFDVSLNSRLIDFIIQKGNLQPTVIFCPTRNFACRTAKYLSKLNVPNNKSSDKKLISVGGELGECIRSGIAVFHHGGLSQRERKVVEVAFEKREVGIVCTVLNSETLNFNFPSAQLYILKSTIFYKGKDFKEFTNDQLNQFIERCHPKKCIVMTSEQTKLKFETPGVISKNSGGNCVESYLHYNFYSSLLTEIRSGRLKSFIECIAWLENTYLYFRFTNNPKLEHYALLECNDPYKGLLELLKLCIEELYKEELVTLKESDTITSTFYGETMIDNRLTLSTIRSIVRGELLQITGPSEFLLTVCKFQEFIKFRLKHNEKSFYKSINKSIRYEQTKSLETCNKVSIIIQYALSNIMSNNHEMGRIGAVFQNDVKFVKVEFIKICQILIDVFQYRRESVGLRYALSFLRNFQHGIWEDDFSVFSQFRELKPALIERFEKNSIHSFDIAKKISQVELESVLELGSGEGVLLMKFLSNSLPEIFMQTSQTINEGSVTIEVHLEFKYFAPRTDSFLFDFVCVNEGKNSCLVDYREVIFQNGCKTKRFSILTNAMRGESIVCYLNSKTLLGVYNVHTFIAGERERRLESVDPVKESLKLPPRKRARFDPVPPSMPKKQGMCHHRCKDKISCLHECCKLNLTACQEEDKSMRDNFDSVIKPRVNKLKRKINLGYSSLEKTKGLFDDSDEEPGSLFATALEMLIKENEEREKVKTKRKNK